MDERYTQVGELIQTQRERLGMTQREPAEAARVSPAVVGRVEAAYRRPTLETLRRLARVLDVEVDQLYEAAGYELRSSAVPLPTYLRRRYGLPEEATSEVEAYFKQLQERYGIKEGESHGN